MLQFKHRDKDYCLLFLFWKSTIVFRIKSGVSSWWILQDIKKEVCASLLHLEASKLSAWLLRYIWRKNNPKILLHFLVSLSNTGPLRSCSEFYLAPYPLPSPYTGSLQSRSDPFLAPHPLPTPFTHVYTSLDWTSVFRPSEFSPNFSINRIVSPNIIGFSWEFISERCELVNLFNLDELVNSQLRQTR